MRSTPSQGRLFAFPEQSPSRDRSRGPSRSARKAARLDELAQEAERQMAESRRAGDAVGFREAKDRALGARRAAELLRAGPAGVADVLGGHEAA
jgi:hypothetical protein